MPLMDDNGVYRPEQPLFNNGDLSLMWIALAVAHQLRKILSGLPYS